MSDVTNRMTDPNPQWPDGMTTSQALAFYLYVPGGIALCFGLLKVALPPDMHRLMAIFAWMLVFLPAWLSYELITRAVSAIPRSRRLPLWALALLGVVLASIVIKPYLIWVSEGVMGIQLSTASKTFPDFVWRLPIDASVFMVLWVGTNVLAYKKFNIKRYGYEFVSDSTPNSLLMQTEIPHEDTPKDLKPLMRLGILAVKAGDKYVHVHTLQGEKLIRARFSSVVEALRPYGLQVHRSYWVNSDAVKGSEKRGQTTFLIINDDLVIPVSRSYQLAAEDAGLLKSDKKRQ